MQAVLQDLGRWFWRLVPANPILVRVVHAGGRRARHAVIRALYLAVLAVAVVIGVIWVQSSTGESASLADFAKSATWVFKTLSTIQLIAACILAPLFTAAAITQEKDSQTFSILLSTPLTNGQIVFGSLLSRLFFVFVLLIAGIPLFCVLMVYGGVTGDKIALAISLAGSTALITGSIAIAISVIKVGTGRTIFSFYLAIATYLVVVYALSLWSGVIPPEAEPAPGQSALVSWLAAFHPFLALRVVLGETPAPMLGAVAHYGFPGKYLLAYPQYSFIVLTFLTSMLLLGLSLFFVRRSALEGEMTFFSRLLGRAKSSAQADERTRKPRRVHHNPIAWREAVTGAAAGGGYALRYSVLGVGLLIAAVLLVLYGTGKLNVAQTRLWLFGVVATELLITLFIATATAATSMTREKESNTIELILATPLTSSSIILGKIRGLVSAAGPLLLVPYATTFLFVLFDLTTGRMLSSKGPGPVVFGESVITMPILLVSFTAFACMLGLQSSIKSKKTLNAVFTSMSIVIAVFVGIGSCALAIKSQDTPNVAAAFMPLTPMTAMYVVVDPATAVVGGSSQAIKGDALASCRAIAFVAALCSAAVYAMIGLAMHRAMVRNFDMVIRKQSA